MNDVLLPVIERWWSEQPERTRTEEEAKKPSAAPRGGSRRGAENVTASASGLHVSP